MTHLSHNNENFIENYQILIETLGTKRFPRNPYCSNGKGDYTYIRTQKTAFKYPQIQINSQFQIYWLVFDVDSSEGSVAWYDAQLPLPTWVAVNRENGHAHIVYGLKEPVCTSNFAHLAPLRYLSSVYTSLAIAMGADRAYSGLLTHNPTHEDWDSYVVAIKPPLYELWELERGNTGANTKNSFKSPIDALEEPFSYGRNISLFDQLRFYAYEQIRAFRGKSFDSWANTIRSKAYDFNVFATPLATNEVGHIAKSVAKWVWKHDREAHLKFIQRQKNKGAKTNPNTLQQARQTSQVIRTAQRLDKRTIARAMLESGKHTRAEIAQKLDVSERTLRRYLQD